MEKFNVSKPKAYYKNQKKRQYPLDKYTPYRYGRQDYGRKAYALYNPFIGANSHTSLIQNITDKKPWNHARHQIDTVIYAHNFTISGY